MLQHELRFGKYEKQIREVAAKRGDPDPFSKRTALRTSLLFYWNAFWDLNSTRPIGFSIGAIPWTAADQYAKRYDLSSNDFELFWAIINQLDFAYIQEVNSKMESDPKTNAKTKMGSKNKKRRR